MQVRMHVSTLQRAKETADIIAEALPAERVRRLPPDASLAEGYPPAHCIPYGRGAVSPHNAPRSAGCIFTMPTRAALAIRRREIGPSRIVLFGVVTLFLAARSGPAHSFLNQPWATPPATWKRSLPAADAPSAARSLSVCLQPPSH